MQEENTTTIPQMVEEVRAGRMLRRNFMKTLAALGLSAAGAGTISAAAALPTPIAKTAPAHPDEQPAQNLQLHQQHLAHQDIGQFGSHPERLRGARGSRG